MLGVRLTVLYSLNRVIKTRAPKGTAPRGTTSISELQPIDGVVSLLAIELSLNALTYHLHTCPRGGTYKLSEVRMKPVLYSIGCINDKTTAIVFAVNQLSPSSIGIYPLAITYPKLLPQLQVRSINLVMAGSPGFGSNELDFICIHSVFHLTQSINLLRLFHALNVAQTIPSTYTYVRLYCTLLKRRNQLKKTFTRSPCNHDTIPL